ncbi:MAG: rod shape-determining protein MreC [Chloroflexi bacterium]|nr:rod shape-determining protein MreC [Chloroflexota bacterium]
MSRLRSEPLLFILLLVSALLIFLHQLNVLRPAEDLLAAFFSPLQGVTSGAWRVIEGPFAGFRDAAEWRQRFEERQAMIDQLLVDNTQLREKEQENETLREMLGFKQANQNYRLMAADVIGRDPNPLIRFIVIDRGSADGVGKGMPVVTARGLIGQVREVAVKSSKVMLITDLASSVNARAQESRASGVVQGTVGGGLVLQFVPQGEKLSNGYIVLTSGLGGHFPKGLVIGQVQSIRGQDVDAFQTADIRPSVDFQAIESVFVIINFPAE